ncbi:MAG: hypothetical protein ABL869_10295 [Candidatus Nitrotoga sp.]
MSGRASALRKLHPIGDVQGRPDVKSIERTGFEQVFFTPCYDLVFFKYFYPAESVSHLSFSEGINKGINPDNPLGNLTSRPLLQKGAAG